LGGNNGSLSINLRNLKGFQYNNDDSTATFETGNLLGDLNKQLEPLLRQGVWASIDSIGSGGHLAIGGMSPLDRLYGLALDRVVEAEVVLADGSIVTASEQDNDDLFFAIRGAAWSFGIVTKVKVKTAPALSSVGGIWIIPGNLTANAEVYSQWQELTTGEDVPWNLASALYVYDSFLVLTADYKGPEEDFAKTGLDAITSRAIPYDDLKDVLNQLNVTATFGLFDTLSTSGLIGAFASLPPSDIFNIFRAIPLQKLLPALQSGNQSAIIAAIQTTNNTFLNALPKVVNGTTLTTIFTEIANSNLLNVLSNTTALPTLAPVFLNLNLTSIATIASQLKTSGMLDLVAAVPGAPLSSLFSTLFTSRLPTHFAAKSLKLTASTLPDGDAVSSLFETMRTTNRDSPIWFVVFSLSGGFVSTIPSNATAYPHRDALLWIQSYTVSLAGPVSDAQHDFLRTVSQTVQSLVPGVDDSAYAGYVDPELQGEAAERAYWGSNLETLKQIKKAYDPQNVFRNPQSIEVGSD
jgi:hypothetical protein